MWFVAILVGLVSVLIGIFIIKRELSFAVRSINRREYDEDLRRELDELNSSFFDIANDLEGKYSVHEKQIQDIELILREYTNRQIERMRSGEKTPGREKKQQLPKSANPANFNQGDELILPESISRDRVIARDAERLIEEGFSIQETAKRLGVSVGALKLILGINENK